MVSQPILRVENLTAQLHINRTAVSVVENVSFSIDRGKTLAIVGESGCGKSMTAFSLMRILPEIALPLKGKVYLDETDILQLPEKKMRDIRGKRMAMIFQNPSSSLNPVYTIGEQLMEVASLHLNLFGEEAEEKVISALKEVGIASAKERCLDYPHQLSGGMKQRVMIAMALMCEPEVLIADEPTTALDVTIQAQVLALMRSLQERKGTAILLITHDMGIVAEMADDVAVMYAANCIERGTVDEIFDNMSHPYTQALFNSRPNLNQGNGKLYTIEGSVPSAGHYPKGCRFHPRCPFVMDICKHGEVPNFTVKDQPSHTAKCWLLAIDDTP